MQLQKDDSLQIFKQFIDRLNQFNVQELLQKAQLNFAVRQFKLSQLLPSAAQQIYQNIVIKLNRNLIPQSQLNWWENQLRIFVWTLVLYVQLNSTKIQTLTIDDWTFFSSIFPHKQFILFQYQSINILKQHNQAKKWTSQEDELFIKLVNQKGLKCKWSQLAKLLYIDSNKKYFRTPKQCRQRWLNHLDPSKSKSQWQTREDFILIRYVYEKQKRWAEISKLLNNKRNQHSIKNRFKSLITKQLKFHKQKLTEKQLIESIYHRYKAHLSKGNNNDKIDDDGEKLRLNSQEKFEDMNENQKKSLYFPSQNNIGMNRLQLGRHHSQTQMYPFTWYQKQESFVPFRKSQEYFPFSSYQNQQNMKRNFITSYSQNLEEFNMREKICGLNQHSQTHGNWEADKNKMYNTWVNKNQMNDKKMIKTENHFFTLNNHNVPSLNNHHNLQSFGNQNISLQKNDHNISLHNNNHNISLNNKNIVPLVNKQHKMFPIPNQHYQPQNHFYSDLVLNSAFGSSSQIQLGSNYQQFLPVQQNQSIENHIINNHEFNWMNKKVQVKDEMDEQERKIRAQLFLLDNPMDIVKQFFYHDKSKENNNIKNQD